MHKALRCRMCQYPSCTKGANTDVRGIMRRVAVGNYKGAYKAWLNGQADESLLEGFEENCIIAREQGKPIPIREVITFLKEVLNE